MIKSIRLQNFFSFRDETIEFNPDINVLVGINGSGKSNIFKAIELLKYALSGADLKPLIIDEWGGVGAIEHSGLQPQQPISITYTLDDPSPLLRDGINKKELEYFISIERGETNGLFVFSEHINFNLSGQGFFVKVITDRGRLVNCNLIINDKWDDVKPFFADSEIGYSSVLNQIPHWHELEKSKPGSQFILHIKRLKEVVDVYDAFQTQKNAELRKPVYATAAKKLTKSGGNLAQVLNFLKDENQRNYLEIEKALEHINENFSGLDYSSLGGYMELKLREKGLNRSIPLAHISDGTLRYICLLVILYNPQRGFLVSIDEPELGLHPDMIRGLAEGIKSASEQTQFIVSTHHEGFLDQFEIEQIIAIEKNEHNSSFATRFKSEDFGELAETKLSGVLWDKGHFGARRW